MEDKNPLRFLDLYGSENTVRMYRNAMHHFFKMIYGEGVLESQAKRYLQEDRDRKEDLTNFFLLTKDYAPVTRNCYISTIYVFLMENGIEVSEQFKRSLRRKSHGNGARTADRPPSINELKKIINYLPMQGKALFLCMASSGMRIGEALGIEVDDIDLEGDPARINIMGEKTKTGDRRWTFISSEAKEYVKEWLRRRGEYINTSFKRSAKARKNGYQKQADEKRLFPLSHNTATLMWKNALNKAGFNSRDKSTNRYILHPHALRKFFRTQMGSTIPVDIAEALMGHSQYLTDVYRKYSVEQLAEAYKKGESSVTVMGHSIPIDEMRKGLETHIERISGSLISENTLLRQDIETLKGKVASLEKLYDRLFELAPEDIQKIIEEGNRKAWDKQREENKALLQNLI